MDKKIILITGASSGIGRVTALELAKQGHRLIIHGRNEKKTTAVKDEIIATTGNQDIEAMTADLSLMVEVKAFADKVKAKYDHLDVLINNAGGQFGNTREVTAEGYEKNLRHQHARTIPAYPTADAALARECVGPGGHRCLRVLPTRR
jgi:Short-chain dehydrogenases of various substrate specificities